MDVHLITDAGVPRAPSRTCLSPRAPGRAGLGRHPLCRPGGPPAAGRGVQVPPAGHPGLREPQPRPQGPRFPTTCSPLLHSPGAGQGRTCTTWSSTSSSGRATWSPSTGRSTRRSSRARVPGDERGPQADRGRALPAHQVVRPVARHRLGHDPPPEGFPSASSPSRSGCWSSGSSTRRRGTRRSSWRSCSGPATG